MDRQRFLLPMLALITVWRLALLPTIELSPDEALALFFSKHHDLWHLEMGPLTPWLVRLSTLVAGSGEIGVRLLAPILAFIASINLWRLCRGVFDTSTASWTTLIVQVLPAFNLAATTMTSGTVGMTCVITFLLMQRRAMHRADAMNSAWIASASLMLAAILADWRNVILWLSIAIFFACSARRRHHLWSKGFLLVTGAMFSGLALFITWNVRNDWPTLEAGEAEPLWQTWPNLLRWFVLASPFIFAGMVRATRHFWKLRLSLPPDTQLILVVTAAYAVLDFGWSPRERWPHIGFAVWMLPAAAMLASFSLDDATQTMRRKIILRTVAIILASLHSMFLLRTDMLRNLGVPWAFQKQLVESRTWRSFLRADPAGNMLGWSRGGNLVHSVLASTVQPDSKAWFLITSDWALAVTLDAYLPSDAPLLHPTPQHPRLHAVLRPERDQPLSILPRYDSHGGGEFRGQNALFISDAPSNTPPPEIRAAFDGRCELASVMRIMHGGHEVRTLKIFACHGYKPPAL